MSLLTPGSQAYKVVCDASNNTPPNPFKKVIFLDIEGVVVTYRSIIHQHCPEKGERYIGGRLGWHRFVDPLAMSLVYKLAKEFGAQIVLTSTLRNDPHTYSGLCAVSPVWLSDPTTLLSTEVTIHASCREVEIGEFIQRNGVEKYVVFDDRALEVENFVRCDPSDGVTYDRYHRAKYYLADKPEDVQHEAIFL